MSFWERWSSSSSLRSPKGGGQPTKGAQEKEHEEQGHREQVPSSPLSSTRSRRPSSESQRSTAYSAGPLSPSGASTPRTSSDFVDDKRGAASRVWIASSARRESSSPAVSRKGSLVSIYSSEDRAWTSQSAGFNAISGVLNNPLERSVSGKISKADIPPVHQVSIRKVKPSDFDAYLKEIVSVFETYERNRAVRVTGGLPTIARRQTSKALDSPSSSLMSLLHAHGRRKSSLTHSRSSLSGEANGAATRSAAPAPAESLDIVPPVFFEPDFNLENPSTFAAVVEQADVVNRSPQYGVMSNSLLQEKLSHYLDTVEVHLIKEVSLRSSSFFAALSTLKDLHQETLSCVEQIHALREKLAEVDRVRVYPGIQAVCLQRRHANLTRLYAGTRMISEVRMAQPTIQVLLGQGDFVGALDLIAEANRLLRGAQQKPKEVMDVQSASSKQGSAGEVSPATARAVHAAVDLRGVRALLHLEGQLREMHRMIGLMMENEFTQAVLGDLAACAAAVPLPVYKGSNRQHVGGAATTVEAQLSSRSLKLVMGTDAAGSLSGGDVLDIQHLAAKTAPLLVGLLRTDRLASAIQTYREAALKEIKHTIQKRYPPFSTPNSDEDIAHTGRKKDISHFARNLRSMTFDDFLSLLESVYKVLLFLMRRLQAIHNAMASTLKDAQIRGIQPGADAVTGIGADSPSVASPLPVRTPLGCGDYDDDDDDEEQMEGDSGDDEENWELGTSPAPSARQPLAKWPQRSKTSALERTLSATGIGRKAPTVSSYAALVTESSEVCFAAADLAHVRCAKLLAVRADQNTQLNAKDFYRLFAITWDFVTEGESMCGQMGFGLRGTMLSQAKSFLNHFHMERVKQLSVLIENEQWVQAEVPVDFQQIVNRIAEAARAKSLDVIKETTSPLGSAGDLRPGTPGEASQAMKRNSTESIHPPLTAASRTTSRASVGSAASGASPRRLVVPALASSGDEDAGQQGFYAVGCALMLVKMLEDYLALVARVPVVTTDTLGRLVEILKILNSKTCQAVLGAGAMRSAGLKNITAKHIALAAQSLGMFMALVPLVRECMTGNMSPKQAVMLSELDRVTRDFAEHQTELYAKLVSIMNDRLEIHCRAMQATAWDEVDPKQTTVSQSAWMEVLVKETSTLHKVLGKYLPVDALKHVMGNVFDSYTKRLEDEVRKVDVYTVAGKNRLLADIQYFLRRLNDLENVDGPGSGLAVAVNNLKVKERPPRRSSAEYAASTPNGR